MKLDMINSFLIVCFYNGFKSYQVREFFTKIVQKYDVMAINQYLWIIVCYLRSIQEEISPIIFGTIRSTHHLVDWLSAYYIGHYMQGSGKSDKYGFSLLPA